MIWRVSSLAALALALAACGSQDVEDSGEATEATAQTDGSDAVAEPEGDIAAEEQAEEQAAAEEQTPAPATLTVAGTVDSIVLDGEEPMVIVNGNDGTNYLGVTAPGAIDAIIDNTGGIGSSISLECKASDLPPEDDYVWVEGCKLS